MSSRIHHVYMWVNSGESEKFWTRLMMSRGACPVARVYPLGLGRLEVVSVQWENKPPLSMLPFLPSDTRIYPMRRDVEGKHAY